MLTGFVVGAVLGGLGGLVGHLFAAFWARQSGAEQPSRIPAAIGVALALTLSRPVTAYFDKPSADAILEATAQQEPFYNTIKQNAPEAYATLRQAVDEGLAAGDEAAIRANLLAASKKLFGQRLPYASDEHATRLIQLVAEQSRALGAVSPDACVALLRGTPYNFGAVMPKELVLKEGELLADLVSDKNTTPLPKASQAEMEAFMIAAIPQIARKLAISEQEVVDAITQKAMPDAECKASGQLMEEFGNGPIARQGPLIRTLLAEAQKG